MTAALRSLRCAALLASTVAALAGCQPSTDPGPFDPLPPERIYVRNPSVTFDVQGNPIVSYQETEQRNLVDRTDRHTRLRVGSTRFTTSIEAPGDSDRRSSSAQYVVAANASGTRLAAFLTGRLDPVTGSDAPVWGFAACRSTTAAPTFDCERTTSGRSLDRDTEIAVALNDNGAAVALVQRQVWPEDGPPRELYAHALPAGGRWSGALKIADTLAELSVASQVPSVILGNDGSGHALYFDRQQRLVSRRYLSAFTQWQPPVTLAQQGEATQARLLQHPAAPETAALVLYRDRAEPSRIRVLRWQGIGWQELPLPPPPCRGGGAFEAAMNASGQVVLAWLCSNAVYASRFDGNDWSAAARIDQATGRVLDPRVGIDAAGNAVAVWVERGQLTGAAFLANGGWQPPTVVGTVEAIALEYDYADYAVGMSDSGRAVAAWTRDAADGGTRLATAEVGPFSLAVSAPRHSFGGEPVAVTVTLGSPAATATMLSVTSTVNAAALQVPSLVTVAAGQSQVTFSATTLRVNDFVSGRIVVRRADGTTEGAATVTLMPEPQPVATVSPSELTAGQGATLRVALQRDYPVPLGVGLSSDSPLATVLPTVWIEPGSLSITTPVTTAASNSSQRVLLLAQMRAQRAAAVLQLLPTPTGPVRLQVSVDGAGSVTSAPAGIDCRSGTQGDCSEDYPLNTEVALTAIAEGTARFAGFGGDGDCADGRVRMDAAKTCIATFAPAAGFWQRVGDQVNAPNAVQPPAMALDTAEFPVLASIERDVLTNVGLVTLRRYAGTWQLLAPPLGGGVNSAADVAVVVDPSNNPIVAWTEGDGIRSNVYLARLNMARRQWEPIGASNLPLNFAPNSRANWPALAVRPSGALVLAWVEDERPVAKTFIGTEWRALPGGNGPDGRTTARPRLATGPSGYAVLAWLDADAGGAVRVARAGVSNWAILGTPQLGTEPIGDPVPVELGLVVDGNDRPMIGWAQGTGSAYATYVRRWNGSAWQAFDGAPSNAAPLGAFAFGVNSSNQPVIAVTEPGAGDHTVRHHRHTGLGWSSPGYLVVDGRLVGLALAVPPSELDSVVVSWLRTQPGASLETWRFYP